MRVQISPTGCWQWHGRSGVPKHAYLRWPCLVRSVLRDNSKSCFGCFCCFSSLQPGAGLVFAVNKVEILKTGSFAMSRLQMLLSIPNPLHSNQSLPPRREDHDSRGKNLVHWSIHVSAKSSSVALSRGRFFCSKLQGVHLTCILQLYRYLP